MLKLLKYELIGSYRQYLLTFLVFLMGCIVLPFLPTGVGQMLTGFLMLAVFGIVISIFVNIILAYNTSMFKKPGYLTLTLPTSTNQILLSKVIGALIWSTLAMIVLIFGIGILMFIMTEASIGDFIEGIKIAFDQLLPHLASILEQLLIMVVELLATILSFYFTITLVHTRFIPKYKAFVGIAGYFIVGMIGGYIISTPMIANFVISLDLTSLNYIILLVNAIMSIGFFFGTKYLIDRHIEVE